MSQVEVPQIDEVKTKQAEAVEPEKEAAQVEVEEKPQEEVRNCEKSIGNKFELNKIILIWKIL